MLLLFHVNVSIYDLSGEKEPLGFLIDLLVLFFVKEKKPLVGMDLLAIFRVKNNNRNWLSYRFSWLMKSNVRNLWWSKMYTIFENIFHLWDNRINFNLSVRDALITIVGMHCSTVGGRGGGQRCRCMNLMENHFSWGKTTFYFSA